MSKISIIFYLEISLILARGTLMIQILTHDKFKF